jgi:hypothetical protein
LGLGFGQQAGQPLKQILTAFEISEIHPAIYPPDHGMVQRAGSINAGYAWQFSSIGSGNSQVKRFLFSI